MQKAPLTLVTSVFLFVFLLVPLQCQEKTEIGKFRDAECPFPLPEGVVPGENFMFGYVSVPEQHSDPGGKTIELAVAIFPRVTLCSTQTTRSPGATRVYRWPCSPGCAVLHPGYGYLSKTRVSTGA